MLKYLLVVQLVTSTVYGLSCQRCSSENPNSNCRNGTIKQKFTCPEDEKACYTEDIINEDRPPFYRRGCAPEDWCTTQKKSHNTALKFCKNCDMCNNKRIGAADPSRLQCYSCKSEDSGSNCRKGSIDIGTTAKCSAKQKHCAQSTVSTSQRTIWERKCASDNYCSDLSNKYGHSLEECKLCEDDFCNNNLLRIPVS